MALLALPALCLVTLSALQVVNCNNSLYIERSLSVSAQEEISRSGIEHTLIGHDTCPNWKYHKFNNSSCECGDGIRGVVDCSNDTSTLWVMRTGLGARDILL